MVKSVYPRMADRPWFRHQSFTAHFLWEGGLSLQRGEINDIAFRIRVVKRRMNVRDRNLRRGSVQRSFVDRSGYGVIDRSIIGEPWRCGASRQRNDPLLAIGLDNPDFISVPEVQIGDRSRIADRCHWISRTRSGDGRVAYNLENAFIHTSFPSRNNLSIGEGNPRVTSFAHKGQIRC